MIQNLSRHAIAYLLACLLLVTWTGCKREAPKDTTSAPSVTQPDPDELERRLSGLEDNLRDSLPGHTIPGIYRTLCAAQGRHDRAIGFLEELVHAHPDDQHLRIEYANAFIDKIPTCSGVTAVLCRGNLASKSLDQLDIVIVKHPDLWVALYCRGMNHLHWPKVLRHSDDAVADFKRCIDLQKRTGSGNERPYYLRTHVALGDAYTKAGHPDEARKAWGEGLKLFPGAKELNQRLAIDDDDRLLDTVQSKRSLDQGIDTDVSFVDHKGEG